MAYPLFDLGGSGPMVLLAPANGFPPETYTSALEPLLAGHRVVSLPPRAMWPDAGMPPERPGSWTELADDLLEGMLLLGAGAAPRRSPGGEPPAARHVARRGDAAAAAGELDGAGRRPAGGDAAPRSSARRCDRAFVRRRGVAAGRRAGAVALPRAGPARPHDPPAGDDGGDPGAARAGRDVVPAAGAGGPEATGPVREHRGGVRLLAPEAALRRLARRRRLGLRPRDAPRRGRGRGLRAELVLGVGGVLLRIVLHRHLGRSREARSGASGAGGGRGEVRDVPSRLRGALPGPAPPRDPPPHSGARPPLSAVGPRRNRAGAPELAGVARAFDGGGRGFGLSP